MELLHMGDFPLSYISFFHFCFYQAQSVFRRIAVQEDFPTFFCPLAVPPKYLCWIYFTGHNYYWVENLEKYERWINFFCECFSLKSFAAPGASEDNLLHCFFTRLCSGQTKAELTHVEMKISLPGCLEQCLVMKPESDSCMICSQIGVSH